MESAKKKTVTLTISQDTVKLLKTALESRRIQVRRFLFLNALEDLGHFYQTELAEIETSLRELENC